MNEKHDFRYDPLYRIIDETDEIQTVEGKYKKLFDRLKRINNLGIIPEVFEMARYPKYEHHFGTFYQIHNLLEISSNKTIPEEYHIPLKIATLFLHLGHLPYTYSTERSLLVACNLGDRSHENNIKSYVKNKINNVLNKSNFDSKKKQKVMKDIFSIRDYKLLYRFFSTYILINKWRTLKNNINGLNENMLKIIINDLIDKKNDGYTFLNLADMADYVQRDALYFGTVRIDISPKHLYSNLSRYMPEFSVKEEKLIEANLSYLTERFYDHPNIICFSRLYEKILASIMMSKNFNFEWLEKYDDMSFKRLITENLDINNNNLKLPSKWIKRAKNLFSKNIHFTKIFDIPGIPFQKEKDIITVEYELIGKKESKRGLLSYPFESGILLTIDIFENYKVPNHSLKNYAFPVHPHYEKYSISVFQNETNKSFIELLKLIKNLSMYLSVFNIENVKEGLANQMSWTNKARLNNTATIKAIANSIKEIEKEEYKKGEFVEKLLKRISSMSTFDILWHNFENQFLWKNYLIHFLKKHKEEIDKGKTYEIFIDGLLSLPNRLLQFPTTKIYLDKIYNKLLEMIDSHVSEDKKGEFFEALWLIDKIRTKRGKFQLFLNGMVVIDSNKPKEEQDKNEFDIIELIINENGEAECRIYACSIANDYKSKNEEQLRKLADHIHNVYSNLKICTKYTIPTNKRIRDWSPKEEDAGRNYNWGN